MIFEIYLTTIATGQTTESLKLLELAKGYKDYWSEDMSPESTINSLNQDVPENLKAARDFIVQTITMNNSLMTKKFLTLPDEQTIRYIHIIRALEMNMYEYRHIDNKILLDSLLKESFPRDVLVDNYYEFLFIGVGNKNKPRDYSSYDFNLQEYNLADETEKGIFFLRCMNICGLIINGFMNRLNPPDTKRAYIEIRKFPKFNGQPYYKFRNLNFPDFEINIHFNKYTESYKGSLINLYFDVLIEHLICLAKEAPGIKEKEEILSESILRDKELFKYSKKRKFLEEITQLAN